MKFRAVIFDLWKTLVPLSAESVRALYGQMADAAGALHEEFTEVWRSGRANRDTGALGDSVRSVLDQLGLEADPQLIIAVRRDWTRTALAPRPDAISTLEELRTRGYRLGLITVCSTEVAELWEASAFGGLVDVTVFSCEVGIRKPDPRIYEICCERLGVDAQACLFVGDGDNDELLGAERVGMTAVQLRAPGEELTEPGTRWEGRYVERLGDVLDMV